MLAPPFTVLLVEDSIADARLVRELLADVPGRPFTLVQVDRLGAAIARLADGGIDAILLDLSLPDAQGLAMLDPLHAAAPGIPIVVLSGNDDEVLAQAGVRDGAQDYLVKGRVGSDLLARTLRHAMERQRADERLAARTRALEAKTREQDAFVYTVSHDLKAPLVSLQGLANLLLEDYGPTLDSAARGYIERISANAERMAALLADLVELSRVGRVETEVTAVDLATVVASVTEGLGPLLAARGASVSVATPLPLVQANQTRLTQLFQNLIANAIHYTPAARPPHVRVACIARPDAWEITVQDNGCGIPSEYQDKVFTLFQRLPDGKPLNPAGTGVGLAIVARIVETSGGHIWIGPSDSAGTTFHFTLPRLPQKIPHT